VQSYGGEDEMGRNSSAIRYVSAMLMSRPAEENGSRLEELGEKKR